MKNSYDVFINGCGTVGRALTMGLHDLGIKNVLVSVKSSGRKQHEIAEKLQLKRILEKTGYDLIVGKENYEKEFSRSPLNPLDSVTGFVEKNIPVKIILDGTPNKPLVNLDGKDVTIPEQQKKVVYQKIVNNPKVIFSGGSPKSIARSVLATPNSIGFKNPEIFEEQFLRQVSCNVTMLANMLATIGSVTNWNHVDSVNTTLIRRFADPWELHKSSPIGMNYDYSKNTSKTKYVEDVKMVLPEIKNVDFRVTPVKAPWREFHYGITQIFGELDYEKIYDAFEKNPFAILWQNDTFGIDKVISILENRYGIHQAKITTPIYRLMKTKQGMEILSLTPQQWIDRVSKATITSKYLGLRRNIPDAFDFVMNNMKEGDMPLKEFNQSLQNDLNH